MVEREDIAQTSAAGSHPAARAYAALAAEIAAVQEDELIPIKTDVINAVTLVLGNLPEIRAQRPAIDEMWRRFDLEQFDKLELYARALHHAHILWRAASQPKAEVTRLAAELDAVRDVLLKNAEALAAHGLVDGERLKEVKKQPGYRPLASDVATVVEVIRERWSAVANKTPLTLGDLDSFAAKSLDLLAAIGIKEQASPTIGEAALTRNRAFTLFSNAYENARRAILYLRPNDGDEIAPSLYQGRGGRGASEAPPSESPASAAAEGSEPAPRVNNPTGLPATPPLTS